MLIKNILLVTLAALAINGCDDKTTSPSSGMKNSIEKEVKTSASMDEAVSTTMELNDSLNTTTDQINEFGKIGGNTLLDKTDEMVSEAKDTIEAASISATSTVENIAASAGTSTIPAITPAATSEVIEAGKNIYTSKCFACHGTGAAGAPKLSDASWAERKKQGINSLVDHAIKGYQGSKGYMPPKGGDSSLKDQDVFAAVSYMVNETK